MRILVTGGAGYIGSHTCVELLNAGYDVIVVDNYYNSVPEVLNRVEKITGKSLKRYECDIRDRAGLEKIFGENSVDAVIHFAGLKAVGESSQLPLLYYENNISGSVTLFEVMEKYNCKKIVFSSSATVYGNNPIPYKETMTTGDVSNPYGRTKHFIEQILGDVYKADNEWSISLLRYFNPIGAHESGLIGEDPNGIPNNLMPYICQVASGRLEKLHVFGDDYDTPDGSCIRDYINVTDLAMAHIKAVERMESGAQKQNVEVFNIGTGKGTSVFEVIRTFEDVTGVKLNYKVGPRREGDIEKVWADASYANNELGWSAKKNLRETLASAWKWQTTL